MNLFSWLRLFGKQKIYNNKYHAPIQTSETGLVKDSYYDFGFCDLFVNCSLLFVYDLNIDIWNLRLCL
jgi:hypothetical protein